MFLQYNLCGVNFCVTSNEMETEDPRADRVVLMDRMMKLIRQQKEYDHSFKSFYSIFSQHISFLYEFFFLFKSQICPFAISNCLILMDRF